LRKFGESKDRRWDVPEVVVIDRAKVNADAHLRAQGSAGRLSPGTHVG